MIAGEARCWDICHSDLSRPSGTVFFMFQWQGKVTCDDKNVKYLSKYFLIFAISCKSNLRSIYIYYIYESQVCHCPPLAVIVVDGVSSIIREFSSGGYAWVGVGGENLWRDEIYLLLAHCFRMRRTRMLQIVVSSEVCWWIVEKCE